MQKNFMHMECVYNKVLYLLYTLMIILYDYVYNIYMYIYMKIYFSL